MNGYGAETMRNPMWSGTMKMQEQGSVLVNKLIHVLHWILNGIIPFELRQLSKTTPSINRISLPETTIDRWLLYRPPLAPSHHWSCPGAIPIKKEAIVWKSITFAIELLREWRSYCGFRGSTDISNLQVRRSFCIRDGFICKQTSSPPLQTFRHTYNYEMGLD